MSRILKLKNKMNMKNLIEKVRALRLYFVRKRPTHNINDDSLHLLNVCDNYMNRYRAKLPIGVVEKINELSYYLEELSKDVS